jgi:hypothetical protein
VKPEEGRVRFALVQGAAAFACFIAVHGAHAATVHAQRAVHNLPVRGIAAR